MKRLNSCCNQNGYLTKDSSTETSLFQRDAVKSDTIIGLSALTKTSELLNQQQTQKNYFADFLPIQNNVTGESGSKKVTLLCKSWSYCQAVQVCAKR